ncbi:MAG: baseplate J/gp47 family protein [Alphaproteobacteria bacterium]
MKIEVNDFGVITTDSSEIKSDFEKAYKKALGDSLDIDASSPFGQLITNDVANTIKVQDEFVKLSNSFSVLWAKGSALDSAASFFGYYRKNGTSTVVQAVLTGLNGTKIPSGSKAGDGENEYILLNSITIGISGEAIAQFKCSKIGSVKCLKNSLKEIITIIPGWDTVNNEFEGILGYKTESDNIFRSRIIENWMNIRAKTILGSIIDNIYALKNVKSIVGRENPNEYSIEIDGVELKPHSIFLCVYGGDDEEVAKVMADVKTSGTGTNGDIEISYYDEIADYTYRYNIFYPKQVKIKAQINYMKNDFSTADIETEIENRMISYIAENPFNIKKSVSAGQLINAYDNFNQADILSIKLFREDSSESKDYLNFTIKEMAFLDEVVVNEVSNG